MLVFGKTWCEQFVEPQQINGLVILFLIAEQEGDVFIIERRCSMELDVSCEFDDHEGTPGDYDRFCICNTSNCNIDRECFKTCTNGTSTTAKPTSTTSQDHVRLTCQDCGDSPCKDINDNGVVKECDESAFGCLYSEHHGSIPKRLKQHQFLYSNSF